VLAESIGKTAFPGLWCPCEAQLASFEVLERPVIKTGLHRAKAGCLAYVSRLNREFKMEIPGKDNQDDTEAVMSSGRYIACRLLRIS
jgi:hypothetical protein